MIQMIVAAEGTISINCHFLFSISGFGTVLILFHTCWHFYQKYCQIVDHVVSSIFSLVYSQVDTFTINISSNAPHSWPLSPTYFVYSLFISCILLFFVCILYISRQITGWHIYHQYLQQRSPTVGHFHPLMTHSIYLQQSTSRYIENIIMPNIPFTSTLLLFHYTFIMKLEV